MPQEVAYRPGRPGDLVACTAVWKAGIEDYQAHLGQPPLPDDLGPLGRLLAHTLETDPDRFWVAVRAGTPDDPTDRAGDGGETVVGFSAATVREGQWFLAMLFVDPPSQADGIGSALMDRAQAGTDTATGPVPCPDDPGPTGIHTWGMCTDAAQPISNALYARRGMLPRLPIWRLFGEVRRDAALPALPAALEAVPFEAIAADGPDGHRRLADLVDALDREVVGAAHPLDHAYLRRDGRAGFLVRERAGARRALGYAYGSGIGRLGPVAALDPGLHPALIGTAIRDTPARGPVAIWVPGTAAEATRALLAAGLHYDGFPGIVCWSSAVHPFERYVPISLAIV